MKKIEKKFKKLTTISLNRLSIEEFKSSPKTPIVIILDNVRSALNVGSAFRTGDAFLVSSIALCGITAKPPHREILKTAIGATKSVDWQHFEDTTTAINYYKKEGFLILAVEQAENSLALQHTDFSLNQKLAVVFGNEVKGVDPAVMALVDDTLEIPQFGTKHSFNISVSMGIVLWELAKQVRPDLID